MSRTYWIEFTITDNETGIANTGGRFSITAETEKEAQTLANFRIMNEQGIAKDETIHITVEE